MTAAKFYDEKDDYDEDEIPMPRKPGEAPDGGWGWCVTLGAFICNVFICGIVFSYALLNTEVSDHYEVSSTDSASVGILMVAFALLGGPASSVLIDKFSCRKVAMAGSVVVAGALLVSTYAPSLTVLQIIYGVVGGVGLSLVYVPSIVIVSYWFEHKRAFTTGLAVCGSSIGALVFPAFVKHLLVEKDWQFVVVVMAGLVLNCAVGGAFFRPLTHAVPQGMKRGIIHRGAIMNALIAEKARQRTISNGSLDNCIITKDNRLIKIDKIDLRNKSNSYINRLKETFGFSSRSLNRSKNSLVVPKVMVDPNYKRQPSPKPSPSALQLTPQPTSTPPTPKRDSGCGSLESPKFKDTCIKSHSYEAIPNEETWNMNLTVALPPCGSKLSFNDQQLSLLDSPRKSPSEKQEPCTLSNIVSPAGSGHSLTSKIVSGSLYSGKSVVIPMMNGSVMTVPSLHSMETMLEEETDCKLCRKVNNLLDIALLKSPTFLLLVVSSVLSMLGFVIPFIQLPVKASGLGISEDNSKFLISVLLVGHMIGCFIIGWFADRPWVSPVLLNNIFLILAAILSFFSPMYVNNAGLSFYAAVFGFLTAAFWVLRSIILIDLFGKDRLVSAFGLLICFQGVAVLSTFWISELLSGDNSFYFVGFMLTGAGFLGFPLMRLKRWEERRQHSLHIVEIEELSMPETYRVELCESTI